jgi:hypothetical protein
MLVVLLATQMGVRTLPKAWRTLNTDFPNYYLTASLVHERYDTSRIYDWVWFQRQKDHRDIDQRMVGMTPLTPFSALVIYPLTSQSALSAKHRWLILNVILLVATLNPAKSDRAFMGRLALIALLSFPLRTNFLFGQYYVLLLLLLTLACWLYVRRTRFFAGMMVGLASGLKTFPILYLFYFLRKRDLKVFAGGVTGALTSGAISIYVFGWELNRTYLLQVMPSALLGEASDPYNLQAASLSSLLHRFFIYEPQLNQHPAISAPWLFAVLYPVQQMALIGPALVFAMPNDRSPYNLRLEWAAILMAMRDNGYHVAVEGVDATKVGNTGDDDELGIAAANGDRWVEQTGHESAIISVPEGRTTIRQAESPVASFDGRWLAFLREDPWSSAHLDTRFGSVGRHRQANDAART